MTKTISALKARKNLGEILNEVYYNSNDYIIERAGKPMVRLLRFDFLSKNNKNNLKFLIKNLSGTMKTEKSHPFYRPEEYVRELRIRELKKLNRTKNV